MDLHIFADLKHFTSEKIFQVFFQEANNRNLILKFVCDMSIFIIKTITNQD